MSHRVILAALALLCSQRALGQRAAHPADARVEARQRFDRGLRLFNQNSNEAALSEFLRVYDLIPHPRVLYNIGLVHAEMHSPIEAVAAFDRVLAAPGDLEPAELQVAASRRADQAALIGELVITASVAGARIELDNVDIATTPVQAPLSVASGEHIVGVIVQGQYPERRRIVVAGRTRVEVHFELRELPARLAQVTVNANIPGADILIDGNVVGKTPLAASLALAPGTYRIEARRLGYVTALRSETIGEGVTATVQLDLAVDPAALHVHGGTVSLRISEPDAVVIVDSKPRGGYRSPLVLPPGKHALAVQRAGFFPFERDIDVATHAETLIRVELQPNAQTRADYTSSAKAQRTWGIVSLTAGAVFVGGGAAFLLINQGEKKDAKLKLEQSDLLTPGGDCSPPSGPGRSAMSNQGCELEASLRAERYESIRDRDLFGWIGMGVGTAALGLSAFLLLSGDDPERYELRPESDVFALHDVTPVAWLHAGGGGLGFSSTF